MNELPIDNPYLPANHQDIDNIPDEEDYLPYPGRAFKMTEVCSRCRKPLGIRYETRRSMMDDLLSDELRETLCEECKLKIKC